MLFDFFYKNKADKDVREFLGRFRNAFSVNQKEAILCSLFLIANCDNDFEIQEQKFFEHAASLLGYKNKESIVDISMKLCDREKLSNILQGFNENQKDVYIIVALGMIYSDGQTIEVELDYLMTFFDDMGITQERVDKALEKYGTISKYFKS